MIRLRTIAFALALLGASPALAVQPDGAFLIGGDFTEVNGRPRLGLARIHSDEAFAEGFVEFTAPVFTVEETAGEATIAIRRTGSPKTEARLRVLTADAAAIAGADYQATSEPRSDSRARRRALSDPETK